MKEYKLITSARPHIFHPVSVSTIMRDVLIALLPSLVFSCVIFGARAFVFTAFCVLCCVLFEWIFRKALHRSRTIGDFSAAVTGVILAFSLPSSLPLWMAAVGCFIAIIIVKQLFGGIGRNFVNPAALAQIALLISFPERMNSWTIRPLMCDAVVNTVSYETGFGSTPLMLFASGGELPSDLDMFLGFISGATGEISAALLLLGGVYLLIRRVISPYITLSYFAGVALVSLLFGHDPLFQLFAGSVMLGAVFMANDYTNAPLTICGKLIFGFGCGALTMLIRLFSVYQDGVCFAIVLMDLATPYIDMLTKPRPLAKNKAGERI